MIVDYVRPLRVAGPDIIEDPSALVATDERRFPVSRHRSARVHKKLVKRFGGEFVMMPVAYEMIDGPYIVHPQIAAELRRWLRAKMDAEVERQMFGLGQNLFSTGRR